MIILYDIIHNMALYSDPTVHIIHNELLKAPKNNQQIENKTTFLHKIPHIQKSHISEFRDSSQYIYIYIYIYIYMCVCVCNVYVIKTQK